MKKTAIDKSDESLSMITPDLSQINESQALQGDQESPEQRQRRHNEKVLKMLADSLSQFQHGGYLE